MAKKINKYVMAVREYDSTVKMITEGRKIMPKEAKIYTEFFDNVIASCSELAGLKKFIKTSKFAKKECIHYWEGLITLNYTIIIIEYDTDDENFVENACDNELIKFISVIR